MFINWTLVIIALIALEIIAVYLTIIEGIAILKERRLDKEAKNKRIDFKVGA